MCIPLVARVRSVGDGVAEVELIEGEVVQVSTALFPDVAVDEHVLLDRGLIIEVVTPEEAERLLSFFADLASLWEEEDARA
ncbi:HypC/HybG/HupF family hydrogenase formation chaperone [Sphaerobacter thermophilus]|jgi:hydrogenase expression/formation protein HypC|uniref:HypC/HybG/HupF family hydrogenase formation chaperone n=1 Tax=Sphaerobacter thermophilus TaxID=2057 RepID=UPI000DB5F607|nr:MAG: hydrogenase assembly protein HypC [Sphaerobacter thermophilus]